MGAKILAAEHVRPRIANAGEEKLPARFHLIDNLIGQTFDGPHLSSGHTLPAFRHKVDALGEVERQFALRYKTVLHQQIALAVGPSQFDGYQCLHGARFVGSRFRDRPLGLIRDPTCQRAIRTGAGDDFIGCSKFHGFPECFRQLNSEIVPPSIVAHNWNVDRANVGIVERAVAQLITRAANEGSASTDREQ